MPTPTEAPVPPPLEATFLRIINPSSAGPQFQVKVKNTTERPIKGFRMEICPKDLTGQPIPDRDSGKTCFVVSDESQFQPANARPPTGYVEVADGLYEKTEDGVTIQWATTRYLGWVGTGFEAARQADVFLTYAEFGDGQTWENGALSGP